MISHAEFGKLRLVQFLTEEEIDVLEGWEFDEKLWVGESFGFSEWLRLEEEPDVLRSLALNLSDFPQQAFLTIIKKLGFPLWGGMSLESLVKFFGKPLHEEHYIKDRITYNFALKDPEEYLFSCTVLNEGGLIYLVIQTPHLPSQSPLSL